MAEWLKDNLPRVAETFLTRVEPIATAPGGGST